MRGLPSILSLFRNEVNKFNNTGAQMLDSIYHLIFKIILKSYFIVKMLVFAICVQLNASFHNVSRP